MVAVPSSSTTRVRPPPVALPDRPKHMTTTSPNVVCRDGAEESDTCRVLHYASFANMYVPRHDAGMVVDDRRSPFKNMLIY